MDKTKLCLECAAPLLSQSLERAPGTAGGWAVALIRFPILACPAGHERREAYADFNVRWSEELARVAPIWARATLVGRLSCPSCGGALERGRAMRTLEVCANTPFAFTAAIEGPWNRCASCDELYLNPRDDVFEAFADALGKAKVRRY